MRTGRQPFKRKDRVSDVLRQVLAEILMTRIHHRGLEEVTITAVNISADLHSARVFYRVLDPTHKSSIARSLQGLSGLVRKRLGDQLRLRYTPSLKFEYDGSLEYGSRIEELLAQVRPKDPAES